MGLELEARDRPARIDDSRHNGEHKTRTTRVESSELGVGGLGGYVSTSARLLGLFPTSA